MNTRLEFLKFMRDYLESAMFSGQPKSPEMLELFELELREINREIELLERKPAVGMERRRELEMVSAFILACCLIAIVLLMPNGCQ